MNSGGRARSAHGRILVVEDEVAAFECLERIVSRYRPVRHARSFDAGAAELRARRDWCGFVVDIDVGEDADAGFEVLATATKEFPGVPTLVTTSRVDGTIVNRSAMLGAIVVTKPLGEQELLPFLQCVIALEHGFEREFANRLDAVSRTWRLSPREHEILAWFVAGGSREGYLAFTGMAETTFKTHVKHMLAKTAKPSLSEAVGAALRQVLVGHPSS